jgi:hypothetical protein
VHVDVRVTYSRSIQHARLARKRLFPTNISMFEPSAYPFYNISTSGKMIATQAGKAIELGGGNRFVPWALSLSGVPEITDEERAIEDPELVVLSAMAHARDPDTTKSARIALLAQMASLGLDAESSTALHRAWCRAVWKLCSSSLPPAMANCPPRSRRGFRAPTRRIWMQSRSGC